MCLHIYVYVYNMCVCSAFEQFATTNYLIHFNTALMKTDEIGDKI